jgi:hypothetical protein
MPVVTFTVRRGLGAADKSRLSQAMLEAQVAAGYQRADRFHRFLEVDRDDLLVDPRFPDYATDRTDRFMVVEVVMSSGRPTGTAATIAEEAPKRDQLVEATKELLWEVGYEAIPPRDNAHRSTAKQESPFKDADAQVSHSIPCLNVWSQLPLHKLERSSPTSAADATISA